MDSVVMTNVALVAYLAPLSLIFVALMVRLNLLQSVNHVFQLGRTAAIGSFVGSLVAGVVVFTSGALVSPLIGIGDVAISIRLDALSIVMMWLVTFLSALLIQFSRNYLDGDPRQAVFFSRLYLTIGAVLLMLLSGNLWQLVLAWIGMSFALHQLLVFYPQRPRAIRAARKKFIVARTSDVCLIIAAVLIAHAFGTTDIGAIHASASAALTNGTVSGNVVIAAVLVVFAAALKSAMFPFHGWLLEVMETPTPVSALLHAGLLNAGTFLIVRLGDLVFLSSPALILLIAIGGFTAIFASSAMITQSSVKVSLAYSSAAHMGFMLMLCGFGAHSVAIMHLIAHSFYKAHAFLSSNSVVEYVQNTGSQKLNTVPHPLSLLANLIASLLVFLTVATALGVDVAKHPGETALGVIFVNAVAYLFVKGSTGKAPLAVVRRTTLMAVLVTLAFFALELSAAALLGDVVAVFPAPDTLTLIAIVLAVIAFGSVTMLSALLPALVDHPAWRAFYVHLKNGFYANVLFDRFIRTARYLWKLEDRRNIEMAASLRETQSQFEPRIIEKHTDKSTFEMIEAVVDRAGRRIAPLWPLRHFVAVNPYLGLLEQPFETAAQTLGRRAGAHMTAPRSFYAQAIQNGRITDADLEAALAQDSPFPGVPRNVDALKAFALRDATEITFETIPTIADVAQEVTGTDWAEFVTESISFWAGAYFDKGQSYWKSPWSELPPYAAWRAEAAYDRTPQVCGVRNFRQTVYAMPESSMETIITALDILDIPEKSLEAYLHCLLLTIHGWASYARYFLWEAELYGEEDDTLTDLLAIRLVWEVALLKAFEAKRITAAWKIRKEELGENKLNEATQIALGGHLLLQRAFEEAYLRQLFGQLGTQKRAKSVERVQVQAAFCIDVRSEVFRRALETVTDGVETIGFAGFFGFPIEYVRLGDTHGGAQCPALLTPHFVITESVSGASEYEVAAITEQRIITQRVTKAWRMFKFGAVSCFGFVGPVGLAYLKNLVLDMLGRGRPTPHPAQFGLDNATYNRLSPYIEPREIGDRITGMTPQQRLDVAEGALKAMSLTDNFARIVLLAGHGSTTVNNPYATGLDCGACGGHTGEANARVATQVINDPSVRAGLKARGITIPEDTVFVAALHDTTTDEVTIFDKSVVPASHADDIARLKAQLTKAGQLARAERAILLKVEIGANTDRAVMRRSKDWSQVRPEWGLAGCAAFIVAPRENTAGVDLDGRSFLHSYDWRQDQEFGVLELIMTAPMIVASWINLQYYGSTVDNTFFGSGNKVLHNVVGTLGVLEGNGGDLRVGLPWQSVHDGENYVHEPLRLNVMIQAPIDAMTEIIAKHQPVRQLVDNGWLHLFALNDGGEVTHQYVGDLKWIEITEKCSETI